MKIVNIILTSQNGGSEQVFLDYLQVFKNLGHEVLAILKDDAPYSGKLEELGIEVKKIKNKFGYHDFFAVSNIKKYLEEFDADVVFAHAGRSVCLVRKAIKKIKNKKIILVAINHSMNVKRSIGADLVISVNKEAFYKTIKLGQDQTKSFVIPNAIDLSDAIEMAPKIDLQKKEEIIIGTMGRIDEFKGFEHVIKSLKKLEELSNKKFKLKIAGIGAYENELRSLVKELNLENKVEFCGWITDKKIFFNSIDIFCLSSLNETFGLVLLEAMKYRKPIIATNCDGPKEILRDQVDGLLVNLKPIDGLKDLIADAVLRLVNEPELTNKIVENSFVRLKDKFSIQALETRLMDIVG